MTELLKLKQQRSQQRRKAIIDAATVLFGEQGIDGTSLTQVAKRAGLPLSSLYDYFADKQAIVLAVPDRNFEELYALMDAEAERPACCRLRLRRLFLRTFQYILDNPHWGRVFFLEIWPSVIARQPEIRRAVDVYARQYLRLIAAGIAAGEFRRSTDPYIVLSLLMGSMSHLVAVWLLYGEKFDLLAKAQASYALIEASIIPAASRRKAAS